MLNQLNISFLNKTEQISPRFKFKLNVSKRQYGSFVTVIFSKIGLTGTIEARDDESCNKILPSLGGIVDIIWREDNASEVTNVFTWYIELLQFLKQEGT